MTGVSKVLNFWFGDLGHAPLPEATISRWFQRNDDFDRTIRERFSEDIERAAAGEYDHWKDAGPEGYVALVVLLDQFPRNIYRNDPTAFAFDRYALRYALEAIDRGEDEKTHPLYRAFLYMPLEHSEELALQNRCVALFARLAADAPEMYRSLLETFHEYAIKHQVIIERFGRFPHRNHVLGRETTAEEAQFLTQPGSSF
jgi:uncharacterized protein (DUF924 family)